MKKVVIALAAFVASMGTTWADGAEHVTTALLTANHYHTQSTAIGGVVYTYPVAHTMLTPIILPAVQKVETVTTIRPIAAPTVTRVVSQPVVTERVLGTYLRYPSTMVETAPAHLVEFPFNQQPFADCAGLVTPTTPALNLRSGPGVAMSRVGLLTEGQGLYANQCGSGWCQMNDTLGRNVGFASQRYLACPGAVPMASVQIAPHTAAPAETPKVREVSGDDNAETDLVGMVRQAMELSDGLGAESNSLAMQQRQLDRQERRLEMMSRLVALALDGQDDMDLVLGILGEK